MAETKVQKRMGRPPKITVTDEVLKKLEEAFAIGASDSEACFYADIRLGALYEYQAKYPEFTERKNALKERPVLLARQTVLKHIEDPNTAKWYLERKRKAEFAVRTDITSGDEPIQFTVTRHKAAEITEGEVVENG